MIKHEQPHHCKVIDEAPKTELVELESGDAYAIGRGDGAVFLSLDDINRTLPVKNGEPGLPTVLLEPHEAIELACRLRVIAERC